jgi:hypothetical protein
MDRRVLQALYPNPACSGCAVSAGSGMTVNVAAGQVAVPTANATGTLICTSDAVEPVALAAAPGTNSRIDLVVCQARGNDLDGGANNDFIFAPVTGTVAASPVAPAVPANSVALAQIAVGTGVAAIVAGNITDARPAQPLAVPTVPPADSAWTAPTLTNSWVNAGGGTFAAGYRKVGSMVYLRGSIRSGTIGSAAFTLPAGYRPLSLAVIGTVSNNAGTLMVSQLTVSGPGAVTPAVGSNASGFYLDNLSFDTI